MNESIEVYVLESQQTDGMAMAIALVRSRERWMWADVHVIGRTVAKNTKVSTGIALSVGLESVGDLLGMGDGGPWCKGTPLKLYTDYEQIHDAGQRRRWQTYGSPSEPSPEHDRLQTQLSKWSNWSGIRQINIFKTASGVVNKSHINGYVQKWMKREGWLANMPNPYGRLLALPMLQREVKDNLINRQDMDEACAIAWLAEKPAETSVAGKIYQYWALDRQLIKECHNKMKDERGLQVTLNNLIGATRFKTFNGTKLMRAKCPKENCGKTDSWEHFVRCYEVERMAGSSREDKVNYLVALCRRIRTENPIRPNPTNVPYRGDHGQITIPTV